MTGLEIGMLAVSAASAGMAAVGQMQAASARSKQARYNAQVADINAARSRQAAAEKARQVERKNRRLLGATRARTLSSGIQLEGSALEVLADNTAEAELERLTTIYAGEVAGTKWENQASFDRFQAGQIRRGGFLSAATELVKGGARAYSVLGPFGGAPKSSPWLDETPVGWSYGATGVPK